METSPCAYSVVACERTKSEVLSYHVFPKAHASECRHQVHDDDGNLHLCDVDAVKGWAVRVIIYTHNLIFLNSTQFYVVEFKIYPQASIINILNQPEKSPIYISRSVPIRN